MIRRFTRGEELGATRLNELVDALNRVLALTGDGVIAVRNNAVSLNVDKLASLLPMQLHRAKAQENAPADTGLSVKLVDHSGTVYGEAFDVLNLGGGNWEDLYPLVADEDLLLITRLHNAWYAIGYSPALTVPSPAAQNVVRRAKAQEAAPADTTLSVKLLDSGGLVTGDAFTVTNINGGNWDDFLPHIASGDLLFVVNIDGTWYGMPGYDPVGLCA